MAEGVELLLVATLLFPVVVEGLPSFFELLASLPPVKSNMLRKRPIRLACFSDSSKICPSVVSMTSAGVGGAEEVETEVKTMLMMRMVNGIRTDPVWILEKRKIMSGRRAVVLMLVAVASKGRASKQTRKRE